MILFETQISSNKYYFHVACTITLLQQVLNALPRALLCRVEDSYTSGLRQSVSKCKVYAQVWIQMYGKAQVWSIYKFM